MHPFWALDYEMNGGWRYRVGTARAPWRERVAGEAHLYAPGTAYWEENTGVSLPAESAYVCFHAAADGPLADLVRAHGGFVRFQDSEGKIAGLLHAAALAGDEAGAAGFWRAQAVLCTLIDALLTAEPVDAGLYRIGPAPDPAWTRGFVPEVTAYLRRHLDRTVSLREIAVRVGVSVSTLSHRYRAETGEPPLVAHMRLRIGEAKLRFAMGESLKAIAADLGFCDSCHLSRTFRRVEGMSPREYRHRLNPAYSG
jgi:AraC-like DNA-binding protein